VAEGLREGLCGRGLAKKSEHGTDAAAAALPCLRRCQRDCRSGGDAFAADAFWHADESGAASERAAPVRRPASAARGAGVSCLRPAARSRDGVVPAERTQRAACAQRSVFLVLVVFFVSRRLSLFQCWECGPRAGVCALRCPSCSVARDLRVGQDVSGGGGASFLLARGILQSQAAPAAQSSAAGRYPRGNGVAMGSETGGMPFQEGSGAPGFQPLSAQAAEQRTHGSWHRSGMPSSSYPMPAGSRHPAFSAGFPDKIPRLPDYSTMLDQTQDPRKQKQGFESFPVRQQHQSQQRPGSQQEAGLPLQPPNPHQPSQGYGYFGGATAVNAGVMPFLPPAASAQGGTLVLSHVQGATPPVQGAPIQMPVAELRTKAKASKPKRSGSTKCSASAERTAGRILDLVDYLCEDAQRMHVITGRTAESLLGVDSGLSFPALTPAALSSQAVTITKRRFGAELDRSGCNSVESFTSKLSPTLCARLDAVVDAKLSGMASALQIPRFVIPFEQIRADVDRFAEAPTMERILEKKRLEKERKEADEKAMHAQERSGDGAADGAGDGVGGDVGSKSTTTSSGGLGFDVSLWQRRRSTRRKLRLRRQLALRESKKQKLSEGCKPSLSAGAYHSSALSEIGKPCLGRRLPANVDVESLPDILAAYMQARSLAKVIRVSPFDPMALVVGLNMKIPNALVEELFTGMLKVLSWAVKEMRKPSQIYRGYLDWRFLDVVTWSTFAIDYVNVRLSEERILMDADSFLYDEFDVPAEEMVRARVSIDKRFWDTYDAMAFTDFFELPVAHKVALLRFFLDEIVDVPMVVQHLDWQQNDENCRMLTEYSEDGNEDVCAICLLGGNLLCCEKCPSAYHMKCVGETKSSLPEGEWYCYECRIPDQSFKGIRADPVRPPKNPQMPLWIVGGMALIADPINPGSDPGKGFVLLTPGDVHRVVNGLLPANLVAPKGVDKASMWSPPTDPSSPDLAEDQHGDDEKEAAWGAAAHPAPPQAQATSVEVRDEGTVGAHENPAAEPQEPQEPQEPSLPSGEDAEQKGDPKRQDSTQPATTNPKASEAGSVLVDREAPAEKDGSSQPVVEEPRASAVQDAVAVSPSPSQSPPEEEKMDLVGSPVARLGPEEATGLVSGSRSSSDSSTYAFPTGLVDRNPEVTEAFEARILASLGKERLGHMGDVMDLRENENPTYYVNKYRAAKVQEGSTVSFEPCSVARWSSNLTAKLTTSEVLRSLSSLGSRQGRVQALAPAFQFMRSLESRLTGLLDEKTYWGERGEYGSVFQERLDRAYAQGDVASVSRLLQQLASSTDDRCFHPPWHFPGGSNVAAWMKRSRQLRLWKIDSLRATQKHLGSHPVADLGLPESTDALPRKVFPDIEAEAVPPIPPSKRAELARAQEAQDESLAETDAERPSRERAGKRAKLRSSNATDGKAPPKKKLSAKTIEKSLADAHPPSASMPASRSIPDGQLASSAMRSEGDQKVASEMAGHRETQPNASAGACETSAQTHQSGSIVEVMAKPQRVDGGEAKNERDAAIEEGTAAAPGPAAPTPAALTASPAARRDDGDKPRNEISGAPSEIPSQTPAAPASQDVREEENSEIERIRKCLKDSKSASPAARSQEAAPRPISWLSSMPSESSTDAQERDEASVVFSLIQMSKTGSNSLPLAAERGKGKDDAESAMPQAREPLRTTRVDGAKDAKPEVQSHEQRLQGDAPQGDAFERAGPKSVPSTSESNPVAHPAKEELPPNSGEKDAAASAEGLANAGSRPSDDRPTSDNRSSPEVTAVAEVKAPSEDVGDRSNASQAQGKAEDGKAEDGKAEEGKAEEGKAAEAGRGESIASLVTVGEKREPDDETAVESKKSAEEEPQLAKAPPKRPRGRPKGKGRKGATNPSASKTPKKKQKRKRPSSAKAGASTPTRSRSARRSAQSAMVKMQQVIKSSGGDSDTERKGRGRGEAKQSSRRSESHWEDEEDSDADFEILAQNAAGVDRKKVKPGEPVKPPPRLQKGGRQGTPAHLQYSLPRELRRKAARQGGVKRIPVVRYIPNRSLAIGPVKSHWMRQAETAATVGQLSYCVRVLDSFLANEAIRRKHIAAQSSWCILRMRDVGVGRELCLKWKAPLASADEVAAAPPPPSELEWRLEDHVDFVAVRDFMRRRQESLAKELQRKKNNEKFAMVAQQTAQEQAKHRRAREFQSLMSQNAGEYNARLAEHQKKFKNLVWEYVDRFVNAQIRSKSRKASVFFRLEELRLGTKQLKKRLGSTETRCTNLESQHRDSAASLHRTTAKLRAELEELHKDIKRAMTLRAENLEALKKQFVERQAEANRLMGSLRVRAETLQAQLERGRAERTELSAELAKSEREMAELEAQVPQLDGTLATFSLDGLAERLESLRRESLVMLHANARSAKRMFLEAKVDSIDTSSLKADWRLKNDEGTIEAIVQKQLEKKESEMIALMPSHASRAAKAEQHELAKTAAAFFFSKFALSLYVKVLRDETQRKEAEDRKRREEQEAAAEVRRQQEEARKRIADARGARNQNQSQGQKREKAQKQRRSGGPAGALPEARVYWDEHAGTYRQEPAANGLSPFPGHPGQHPNPAFAARGSGPATQHGAGYGRGDAGEEFRSLINVAEQSYSRISYPNDSQDRATKGKPVRKGGDARKRKAPPAGEARKADKAAEARKTARQQKGELQRRKKEQRQSLLAETKARKLECLKVQKRREAEGLECVCETPKGSNRHPMIFCDHCRGWFHCSCVGIPAFTAGKCKRYACPLCLDAGARMVGAKLGGPITEDVARRRDLSWLEDVHKPNAFSALNANDRWQACSFLPQVGDVVVYYPRLHKHYLTYFPDLRKSDRGKDHHRLPWQQKMSNPKDAKKKPLTEIHEGADADQQAAADAPERSSTARTKPKPFDDEIDCRVEDVYFEFPDPSFDPTVESSRQSTLAEKLAVVCIVTLRPTASRLRDAEDDGKALDPFMVAYRPMEIGLHAGAHVTCTQFLHLKSNLELLETAVQAGMRCRVPLPLSKAPCPGKRSGTVLSFSAAKEGEVGMPKAHGVLVELDGGEGSSEPKEVAAVSLWDLDFSVSEEAMSSFPASSLSDALRSDMFRALQKYSVLDEYWDFVEPVRLQGAPGYESVIPLPMCLNQISDRLMDGYWYRCLDSVLGDIRLVLRNCMEYNGMEAEITSRCQKLIRTLTGDLGALRSSARSRTARATCLRELRIQGTPRPAENVNPNASPKEAPPALPPPGPPAETQKQKRKRVRDVDDVRITFDKKRRRVRIKGHFLDFVYGAKAFRRDGHCVDESALQMYLRSSPASGTRVILRDSTPNRQYVKAVCGQSASDELDLDFLEGLEP